MDQARIVKSAAEMRTLARRGEWRGATSGHCPAYQQANLVILPREAAAEFAAFCTRNPKPCPLIEITPPGDPQPARSAPGADLRTGHTFDHALIEAGIGVRNVECNTTVSMFVTNVACRPAGRFHGPIVMTMRPILEGQVELVKELSGRYPHAHGSPIHVGSPEKIGITDVGHPTYGDPVAIHSGEVPVFWACGVTPQAVALESRPEFMITHEPGIMFLTDLPREGDNGK
jgi:uncharacterized protein YcsI (UPF0317 family)